MLSIKASITALFKRAFGQEIPLEHFVFLCVAFAGIMMSVIGIIGNSSLGLGPLTLLGPGLFLAFDVGCIVYSAITKRWKGVAVVVIGLAVFGLFPFLWFTSGGATGSTMPLMVTSGLCIVIIFKGALRMGMLLLDIVMCISFIVLEYYWPGSYTPYATRFAWYTDLAICIVINFVANAGLAYAVMARYEKAKNDEAELARRLERISLTDPLTGAYNRRFLTACVDEEMRKSYDDGAPLSICIMDIDHFKRINDSYGHVYGDEVLFGVARAVADGLSEEEVFGRYGGEEFLIVFRGRTPEQALPIAEKACERVKAIAWPHGEKITLSCGLSGYIKGIPYSGFIESADKKLYLAKEGGRDRIAL